MTHEVSPIDDPRWREFLDREPHASVFHSPEWLLALHRTYGYRSRVVTTSPPGSPLTNGLLLCDVHSWLTGRRLVSVPFADHCETLTKDSADLDEILNALRQRLLTDRGRYLEFRAIREMRNVDGLFRSIRSYYLHRLDLQPSLEVLFSRCHRNSTQRKIRRADRDQVIYSDGRSESMLDVFFRLLIRTRRRHGVPPPPRIWFRNLIESFGAALKIRVASRDGAPIAAIVTIRYKDTLYYKYGAPDSRHNNAGGMHMLLWKSIEEAKREGLRVLDFGRTDRDAEGLRLFKDRWGADQSTMTYTRFTLSEHSKSNFTLSRHGWRGRAAGEMIKRTPDWALVLAGELAYRHVG